MDVAEKSRLDVQDFRRVVEGITVYVELTPQEAMARIKAHPKDGWCTLKHPSGRGNLLCTHDGWQALSALAHRHVHSLEEAEDHSVSDILAVLRREFPKVLLEALQDEQSEEEEVICKLLSEATEEAKRTHVETVYHIPCVTVSQRKPEQFSIGPVAFRTAEAFLRANESYSQANKDPEAAPWLFESFEEQARKLGWIATVAIPPCAPEVSRRRAEATVLAAIDVLRFVIGASHSADMRLGNSAPRKAQECTIAVERNGNLDLTSSRRGGGALVGEDWAHWVGQNQLFWRQAAHLVDMCRHRRRSEVAERALDALRWFGEATFEPSPGAQIVKYVLALERMTTTQTFTIPNFCARVAILSFTKDDIEQCFRDALRVYSARSQVVHGGASPGSREFGKVLRIAHDLTRTALFRILEIHCFLDQKRKSTLADLNNFFNSEENKRSRQLTPLREEARKASVKKNAVRSLHPNP